MLIAGIQAATGQQWWEIGPRYGIGGASVGSMKTYVDSNLASVTGAAHLVTINLGANDVGSMPVEATFKANLTSIIDSVRAKWSGVKVYVDLTWSRSRTTEHDTLNGWKEDVIDSYAGDNVFVGMDERIWFENGDDGVTYSTGDGVHYNAAAQPVCAVEHRIAILGA